MRSWRSGAGRAPAATLLPAAALIVLLPIVMSGCRTAPVDSTEPVKRAEARQTGVDGGPHKRELAPLPLDLPMPVFDGPGKVPENIRIDPDIKFEPRPPFLAPVGVRNVARDQEVTSSDPSPNIGKLSQITDGQKLPMTGRYVELSRGPQHVTIDLGARHEIFAIVIWHLYTATPRVYRDVIVRASKDADFSEAVALFNNDHDNSAGLGGGEDYEYFESEEGKLVAVKPEKPRQGVVARYVRLWSNGSTDREENRYVEVEVWALPAEGKDAHESE